MVFSKQYEVGEYDSHASPHHSLHVGGACVRALESQSPWTLVHHS